MKKFTNENSVLTDEPVRNDSMRLWSPMRCMMSPTIFVSKNRNGSFISLMRKSDMSDMLMRVFTCSKIQLRMNSTDSCDTDTTNCATSISVMNERLPSRMPTSTSDCVRKGNTNCSSVPTPIPNSSWMNSLRYGNRYLAKNSSPFPSCLSVSSFSS